jgi:hypothetical protein
VFAIFKLSQIGIEFLLEPLMCLLPAVVNQETAIRHLEDLQKKRLIRKVQDNPLKYQFIHVTTQEIAYSTMTFNSRQEKHQKIANWLERRKGTTGFNYPILSHHWKEGNRMDKAVEYLMLAGEEALKYVPIFENKLIFCRSYANKEALTFFTEVLNLSDHEYFEGIFPVYKRIKAQRLRAGKNVSEHTFS